MLEKCKQPNHVRFVGQGSSSSFSSANFSKLKANPKAGQHKGFFSSATLSKFLTSNGRIQSRCWTCFSSSSLPKNDKRIFRKGLKLFTREMYYLLGQMLKIRIDSLNTNLETKTTKWLCQLTWNGGRRPALFEESKSTPI